LSRDVVPRPSVNTWHFRVPSAFGLAAHALPRPPCGPADSHRPTMALRLSPYPAIGGFSPALRSPWLGGSGLILLVENITSSVLMQNAH